MKNITLSFFIINCLLPFFLFAQSNNEADRIVGVWFTEDDAGKVEIYKDEDKYYGKLIWGEDIENGKAENLDSNNPDESLRNRPLIGLNLLKDFEYDGNDVWEDGEIYDPENGKTYSCKMTLAKDGKLNVRGFIGFSLIGRTTTWRKVD